MMTLRRRNVAFLAFLLALAPVARPLHSLLAQAGQVSTAKSGTLPDRLTDAEFWKLVGDISEPGGVFRMADNFVSNEADIGTIAAQIRDGGPHGGVYMGVGPEQNLTYIAAVRPKMVFIVDIRRQAVMHHLLYKAIFEISKDPADFISHLFALPRPAGLDSTTSIDRVWAAYAPVASNPALAESNLARVNALLTKTHGFTFTPAEQDAFNHVYQSFVGFGPIITTNGVGRGTVTALPMGTGMGGGGRGGSALNFAALTQVSNGPGQFNSFLGTFDNFRFLKDLHARNMFVPNSGNFGGPKAIRAVGNYVKEHGATVSAFYVSNVEQYLFMDGIAGAFYDNVRTVPVEPGSVFIRPNGFRSGVALCPIAGFLTAAAAGRVFDWNVAQQCPR
jgi:hypothetical protein